MTDIIERADYFLRWNQVDTTTAHDLIRDLRAALKAAHAENERLNGVLDALENRIKIEQRLREAAK